MTETEANNLAVELRQANRNMQYQVGRATDSFGSVVVVNPQPNEWVIGVSNVGESVFRFIRRSNQHF
jgi:RNA 3'-terminal phosphate cyclase